MFCEPEDFAEEGKEYQIPNIVDGDVDYTDWIDETEEDILRKIMGDAFYDEFILGLNIPAPGDPPGDPPDELWANIVNGAPYTYRAKPYIWKGLKWLLKPYIYSEWITINHKNLAELGMQLPALENGETISPATEIVRAYNTFVERLGNCDKNKNTFHGFLLSDPVGYALWDFDAEDEIDYMNIWNI